MTEDQSTAILNQIFALHRMGREQLGLIAEVSTKVNNVESLFESHMKDKHQNGKNKSILTKDFVRWAIFVGIALGTMVAILTGSEILIH